MNKWNLGQPMSFATYARMPKEAQVEYWLKLKKQYRAYDRMIADMMGVGRKKLEEYNRKRGVPSIRISNFTKPDEKAWERFLSEGDEPEEEPLQAPVTAIGEMVMTEITPEAYWEVVDKYLRMKKERDQQLEEILKLTRELEDAKEETAKVKEKIVAFFNSVLDGGRIEKRNVL